MRRPGPAQMGGGAFRRRHSLAGMLAVLITTFCPATPAGTAQTPQHAQQQERGTGFSTPRVTRQAVRQ